MKLPILSTPLQHIYNDFPSSQDLYYIYNTHNPDPNSISATATISTTKKYFIRKIIYDIFGIAFMLVLVFTFYMLLQSPTQYFQLNDPSIHYPYLVPTVSSVLVGVFSIALPVTSILLFNIFFAWNIWDAYSGIFGSILSYITALIFTSTLWCFVGGIRPHFLSLCKIDPTIYELDINKHLYYTSDVCLNKHEFTHDTFHGFPSGHASTSFAGCIFLASYLAAHLQIYKNGNVIKIFIAFLPFICAIWLSCTRLSDHHHNPIQLAVGILIGFFSACFIYKITYVQGFWLGYGRWAHIPISSVHDVI